MASNCKPNGNEQDFLKIHNIIGGSDRRERDSRQQNPTPTLIGLDSLALAMSVMNHATVTPGSRG